MSVRRSERLSKKPRISYLQDDENGTPSSTSHGNINQNDGENDRDNGTSIMMSSSLIDSKVRVMLKNLSLSARTSLTRTRPHKRKNPGTLPWDKLPGEIKNQIYELSLSCDQFVLIKAKRRAHQDVLYRTFEWSDRTRKSLVPNLLLLNKKTYGEAGPILYHNRLTPDNARVMYIFLHRLGPKAKSWIEQIDLLDIDSSPLLLPAFDALVGTPNSRSITIHSFPHERSASSWRGIARVFYNKMYNWIEAVGREMGNKYAAFDLIKIGRFAFEDDLTDERVDELTRNLWELMKKFLR